MPLKQLRATVQITAEYQYSEYQYSIPATTALRLIVSTKILCPMLEFVRYRKKRIRANVYVSMGLCLTPAVQHHGPNLLTTASKQAILCLNRILPVRTYSYSLPFQWAKRNHHETARARKSQGISIAAKLLKPTRWEQHPSFRGSDPALRRKRREAWHLATVGRPRFSSIERSRDRL